MTRDEFGARNQRAAMHRAHAIVANLIESYFDVGQPEADGQESAIPDLDVLRLREALQTIQARHDLLALKRHER
jgi:hypothetical protein